MKALRWVEKFHWKRQLTVCESCVFTTASSTTTGIALAQRLTKYVCYAIMRANE